MWVNLIYTSFTRRFRIWTIFKNVLPSTTRKRENPSQTNPTGTTNVLPSDSQIGSGLCKTGLPNQYMTLIYMNFNSICSKYWSFCLILVDDHMIYFFMFPFKNMYAIWRLFKRRKVVSCSVLLLYLWRKSRIKRIVEFVWACCSVSSIFCMKQSPILSFFLLSQIMMFLNLSLAVILHNYSLTRFPCSAGKYTYADRIE